MKAHLKEKGAWVLKYWGGQSSNGKNFTKSGIPDLLVCYCGVFLGIELKAPRGSPTDVQLFNLKEIDKAGGIAILLYPKDFEGFKALMIDIANDVIPEGDDLYRSYPFVKKWDDIEKQLKAKAERNR